MHAWCTAQCCTSIVLYKSQVKEQSTRDWKKHKPSSCHLYTNSGAQVLTTAHILAVRQHIHKYHPFICYTWNAMQIWWELKTAFRVGWSLVNLPTALWSCDSTTTKFQADTCKRQCFSQLQCGQWVPSLMPQIYPSEISMKLSLVLKGYLPLTMLRGRTTNKAYIVNRTRKKILPKHKKRERLFIERVKFHRNVLCSNYSHLENCFYFFQNHA